MRRAFLLTLCIALLGASVRVRAADQDVDIAYSALRISLPIFVAMEKGYFRDEGLNVKLIRFDTAQPMMQALVAGTVKVAGYCALPITYNAMLRGGKELYFVTSLFEDQSHPLSWILVRPDAPQGLAIRDLAGKSIGILPTVAFQKWIEQILIQNSLDPKSVTVSGVAPEMQQAALQSGQVDALFTSDPMATAMLKRGVARKMTDGAIVPKTLGDPMLFGSFNVDKQWADRNPEVFAKIVRAIDRAALYSHEHPDEAKLAMKPYVDDAQRSYVAFYSDTSYAGIKATDPARFQDMSDQYVRLGIMPKALAVSHLVVK